MSTNVLAQPPRTEAAGTTLWRYVAIDVAHNGRGQWVGELSGETAADVRAALRRIGLQPIDVRPLRARRSTMRRLSLFAGFRHWWHKQLRARRGSQRAEIYDSVATMLISGLPLLESVQTLVESRGEEHSGRRGIMGGAGPRTMLVELRESLRGGDSLAQAMGTHAGWFDVIDIAMVEAGQHGGTLPHVLGNLAERQERSNELSHKLLGALAYPMLVLLVGLGVVVFLSVKTLPDLTKILDDADIPIPGLTARVMWLGQMLAGHWLALAMVILVGLVVRIIAPVVTQRLPTISNPRIRKIVGRAQPPRVIRQLLVGGMVMQLADLLRSGVPMVDALRVLAPTQRSGQLRRHLQDAAQRIEHGDELSAALHHPAWFDSEIQRLLDIGQASGELDVMLTRIGERYQRRAKRLIDRLTVLLEPAVLLLLAVLVGVVVMAAILPLLALQEII